MRRPVTLLHSSDLHLHWSYFDQSLWTVRGLAAAAAEAGAEAVLVAGDIFDTSEQPDSSTSGAPVSPTAKLVLTSKKGSAALG